jgi:FkbM family methyltransferase
MPNSWPPKQPAPRRLLPPPLRDASAPSAHLPTPPLAPAGSGRITQVEVRLGDHTGRTLRGPSGAVDLHVAVAFAMDPELPLPTIGVVLDYGSVVAAASVVSRTDGIALSRDPQGRGAALVTFPQLPLRKGEYRVSVYLACENAVHIYDQVVSAATLNLEDSAPEPGLVRLPHTWATGHVIVHGRPFVLDPQDSLGLAQGPFEPRETTLVRRLARPGMRCLDVGANIGYYTLLFAQLVGPSGLVVAVEPHPDNQKLLRHNLAPEMAQGRVRLIPAALGEGPGRLPLFQAENAGMHRLYPSVCCSPTFHEVEVRSGDSLDLAPLDIIKIDVEGLEPAVLRGLEATIAASPEVAILAEFSPLAMLEAGFDPAETIGLLTGHGLAPHTLDEDGAPQPLDPAALRADLARIPQDAFPAWLDQLQGLDAPAQAQAAAEWLAQCGYPRPLYETLLWRRR